MFDLGVWKPQSPPPRPDPQHRIDTTPTKIIALLTKGHVECLKFGVGCRLIPPGGMGELRVRSWELGGMCSDRVKQGLYSVGRAGRAGRRYMLSPAHAQFCRRYLAVMDSADLRRIDRMKPMDAVDFIVKQMLSGKSLAAPQTAQTRQGAEGGTRSAIARQKPNGLQGIDRYGIISGTQNHQQMEASNGVSVQGHRIPEQGDRDEVGGESEAIKRSGRLLAGASAVGRGVEGRVSESTRVRDKEAESQTRLVDYAKENGVWDGNVEQTLDKRYGTDEGQKNTDGGEAVVWFDRKRSVAVKAIGLDYYGSPTLALERVELHNKYFPDTKLTLVGFGKIPDVIGKNGEVELYGRPFNCRRTTPH